MDKKAKTVLRKNVGCHLGGFVDLSETVDSIQALGGDSAQVFLSPPIGKPSQGRYRQLQAMSEAYRALFGRGPDKVRLYVHAPYTLNLAKPLVGPEKPYWVDALVRELEMASFAGAEGVVVHVGKSLKLSTAEAEANMEASIAAVLRRAPEGPVLYLETAAGQGTELFVDPKELARFAARLRVTFPGRVALCIDTCHAFAAGAMLSEAFLDELHALCPIGLFHVNDSKKPRGARVDRHDTLGQGHIPTAELAVSVRWARRHDIGCILETPTASREGLMREIQWMTEQ